MFGGCDGNLSDSSNTLSNASATSQAVNIGYGQFFNPNLSVSLSSTSSAGQDPKTQEILFLREENSQLKRRLRDIIVTVMMMMMKMMGMRGKIGVSCRGAERNNFLARYLHR